MIVAVVRRKDMRAGEEVFSLPLSTLMSMSTAVSSSLRSIIGSNPTMPATDALGLHLVREMSDDDSSYAPYIAMLPGGQDGNGDCSCSISSPCWSSTNVNQSQVPDVVGSARELQVTLQFHHIE